VRQRAILPRSAGLLISLIPGHVKWQYSCYEQHIPYSLWPIQIQRLVAVPRLVRYPFELVAVLCLQRPHEVEDYDARVSIAAKNKISPSFHDCEVNQIQGLPVPCRIYQIENSRWHGCWLGHSLAHMHSGRKQYELHLTECVTTTVSTQ
jgi:hypothetical protein